ncbi:MAG: hypothetical protein RBT75_17980, partial [Anaerolineae bacterium]|nr:hypothetical protein [Anaerolineae bacterium]
MKTAPRMVLRDLLRDLGRDLVTDPELTGRLLIERCPDCQAEITLLLQAQRYGVPQSLNTGDVLHPMAT